MSRRMAGMLATMIERAQSASPNQLLEVTRAAAGTVGVTVPNLFLIDMEQRLLQPFPGSATTEAQAVDATVAGRAYRSLERVEVEGDGTERRLYLPLLDGSERLGVMEVELGPDADVPRNLFESLAVLVAELLMSKRLYGDAVVRTRRVRDMLLAAEIQWELLPPLTLVTPDVTITGILEPCYEVGGDVFDYAFNPPLVHVLLADAMGHGLDSSMIASLVIGAYRNCRRGGLGLVETYERVDAVVGERFGPDRFATANLAELDCRTGLLRWINAGHPPPMHVRGGKVVGRLEQPPWLPIGFGDGSPEVAEFQLQPGDAVLWFTDGVVEARSADGGFFGEARLADLLERAIASQTPAPEILRRLTHAVLEHQGGELQDDATLLYVGWPKGGEVVTLSR